MTLDDHKEDIMAALATRRGRTMSLRDAEAAWTAIGNAVVTANGAFREFEVHKGRDASGSRRRNQLQSLVDKLTPAHKTLRTVQGNAYLAEPFGWAVGFPSAENDDGLDVDWGAVDEDLIQAVAYLDWLLDWVKQARDEAASSVFPHRPPSSKALALCRLAYDLGLIFDDQTGVKPAVSNGVDTPFENFMVAVTKVTDFGAGDSGENRDAIKRVIRRLDAKKNLDFQLDLMQPKPDKPCLSG